MRIKKIPERVISYGVSTFFYLPANPQNKFNESKEMHANDMTYEIHTVRSTPF